MRARSKNRVLTVGGKSLNDQVASKSGNRWKQRVGVEEFSKYRVSINVEPSSGLGIQDPVRLRNYYVILQQIVGDFDSFNSHWLTI
jgi:hypothetical protein